jgi:hypothetical protein
MRRYRVLIVSELTKKQVIYLQEFKQVEILIINLKSYHMSHKELPKIVEMEKFVH